MAAATSHSADQSRPPDHHSREQRLRRPLRPASWAASTATKQPGSPSPSGSPTLRRHASSTSDPPRPGVRQRRRPRKRARVDLNRNFPFRWRPPLVCSTRRRPPPARGRLAYRLIRRLRPQVAIWFHQHLRRRRVRGTPRSSAGSRPCRPATSPSHPLRVAPSAGRTTLSRHDGVRVEPRRAAAGCRGRRYARAVLQITKMLDARQPGEAPPPRLLAVAAFWSAQPDFAWQWTAGRLEASMRRAPARAKSIARARVRRRLGSARRAPLRLAAPVQDAAVAGLDRRRVLLLGGLTASDTSTAPSSGGRCVVSATRALTTAVRHRRRWLGRDVYAFGGGGCRPARFNRPHRSSSGATRSPVTSRSRSDQAAVA